jgi:hypothetical protein
MHDINDDLRQSISYDRLSEQLGAPREAVERATELALPTLLRGLSENAHTSGEQAESIINALIDDHDGDILDRDDPIKAVDPDEGQKIVHHIFGDNTAAVEQRLGERGAEPSLVNRLLPMLAPLVMGWLSRRLGENVREDPRTPDTDRSGGLGEILGDMIGGRPSDRGGGLGDLLGGLFGGADAKTNRSDGRPGLGDLVGTIGSLAGSAGRNRDDLPDIKDLVRARSR